MTDIILAFIAIVLAVIANNLAGIEKAIKALNKLPDKDKDK